MNSADREKIAEQEKKEAEKEKEFFIKTIRNI